MIGLALARPRTGDNGGRSLLCPGRPAMLREGYEVTADPGDRAMSFAIAWRRRLAVATCTVATYGALLAWLTWPLAARLATHLPATLLPCRTSRRDTPSHTAHR